MLSPISPLLSACWTICFGEWVTRIVAPQLNELSNATFATVILTRTNAPRRQRRMRDQFSSLGGLVMSWSQPTFVTCDHELYLPDGCPGPCFDNRSAAAHEPSTVALAFAHVAVSVVLKTFPNLRTALLLEDDVIAPPKVLRLLLQRVMHALEQKPIWDFVALGCPEHGKGDAFAIRPGMQTCSRMYMISRTGMEKMANGLPLSDPIDLAMPKIFGLSNRYVYHTSWWPMRHGSYIYKQSRGKDF